MYAFFNASVQGTKRLGETLLTRDKDGKVSLSGTGKKIVAGGMMIGVAQAAILAMAGFGGDEPPEWVKSKNLVIPVGDGKYITIPMPLGFNVFPNELENVISLCPGVVECAAVGVPDDKQGEAIKVFVVRSDVTLTEDDIDRYCRQNLTGYKQPKYIEFRDELPKTNVGKVLRRELRTQK